MRGVRHRGDLRRAVLFLPVHVFGEGQAALVGVAGLAEVGGQGREVVEGDVRRDIDRIRQQQVAQERVAHRLALEAVDDVFAHVPRADPVIDRVVEPAALAAQHGGDMGLAQPGHAEQEDLAVRRAAPVLGCGAWHGRTLVLSAQP